MREPQQDEVDFAVLTQGDPVIATTRLLDALRDQEIPPQLLRVDLEIVASNIFGELMQPAVEAVLRQALEDPATRPAVLRAFLFGCSEESVEHLAGLVRSGRVNAWGEDDLVLLVDAFWTSGSVSARAAVKILADGAGGPERLRDELEKALNDLG